MANFSIVSLSKNWAAAYNSDIPLASLALYPHLLLVILLLLSISMEYMTLGWISVGVEDMVPWHNNCFDFASILQQFKIPTLPQRFVLFITFNSLALNPNLQSMNFIKLLCVCLITPRVEKSRFVYINFFRSITILPWQCFKNRYKALLQMVRQWRHLKMLKRSGYGHLRNKSEEEGHSCALLCPACPQPGVNLPPDWEQAPKEKRFVIYVTVYSCS